MKKLSEIQVGKVFKTKTKEFIVLEHFDNGTTAILQKDFWKKARFDEETNNFAKAEIFKDLNENYYKELADEIGEENIIEHEVDLTMNKGHKDYGKTKALISLITKRLFRKYAKVLGKRNPMEWWWTATADSREFLRSIYYVGYEGSLKFTLCYHNLGGVRPFLIVKSNICISEGE